MAYQAAETPDRLKAIGGVIVVHAGLAAIILSGLSVHTVAQTVERLKTFDINEVPPPPRPPPPRPTPDRARENEGAAGKKALPTPIAAPMPKIVIPYTPPVTASRVPATGSATTSGAATAGAGTGAGGSGTGLGSGGRADYSGFTPARRITRIPNREYRRLASTGIASGSVGVTILVNRDGSVSNCRIVSSSGNNSIDSLMCQLTLRYIRFSPARDAEGHAIAQDITFVPNWWKP